MSVQGYDITPLPPSIGLSPQLIISDFVAPLADGASSLYALWRDQIPCVLSLSSRSVGLTANAPLQDL